MNFMRLHCLIPMVYTYFVESDIAKVFWSGRSQAIRLPKKFRFTGKWVHICREGDKVVLKPEVSDWSWLDKILERLDEDCLAAAGEKLPMQERPEALFQ